MVSITGLGQVNEKSLTFHSSVTHTGLVLWGITLNKSWGISEGLTVIIVQELCTAGLFCLQT